MATPLNNYINYFVNVLGLNKMGKLGQAISGAQTNMVKLGVTTIFVDRVLQSFSRAWDTLNKTLGVTRLGEYSEEMMRMAGFMDIGTKKLQAFNSAVGTLGRDMDFTRDLLQTFNERVSDISSVKGIADDFARIGLSARDFADSEDAIDRFLIFADQLQKVSAKDRMTAVEAILGGDLSVVGQLGGMEEILRLMDEAVDKGHIFSEQQMQLAASFQRAFRSVGRTLTALSNNLGSTLMPTLLRVAELISFIGGEISRYINDYNVEISQTISEAFEKPIGKLEYFFKWWDENIKDLGETFMRLLGPASIAAAVVGVVFFGSTMTLALSVITVFLLVAAVLDDIFTYMRGGNSVFGRFVEYFKEINFGGTLLRATFSGLYDLIVALFDQIGDMTVFGHLRTYGGGALKVILSIVMFLVNLFGSFIGLIGVIIVLFVKGFVGAIEVVLNALMAVKNIIEIIVSSIMMVGAMMGDAVLGTDMAGAVGGVVGMNIQDLGNNIGGMGRGLQGAFSADVGGGNNYNSTFNISTTDPAAATTAAGESNMRMERASTGK